MTTQEGYLQFIIKNPNTKYAKGGLAVVMDLDTDNFQKHIDDTMRAGDYENNREVVEMVIKEGPDRFREIVEWGVNFDPEWIWLIFA